MLSTASFNKDKMRAGAGFGFINATDCADYLVKKGLPFRSAYKIVGELVAVCIEKGYTFETLPLDEYKAVDLDVCVNGRNVPGGPAKEAVEKQIANLEKFIKEASDE